MRPCLFYFDPFIFYFSLLDESLYQYTRDFRNGNYLFRYSTIVKFNLQLLSLYR